MPADSISGGCPHQPIKSHPPTPPPPDLSGDDEGRIYRSLGLWGADAAEHANDHRKQVWQESLKVVRGEEPSPFQAAAVAGDLASLVTHWGDSGVRFINADVSIALSRLPVGPGVGLAASHRGSDAGSSAGSATFFDALGTFGSASVVALANQGRVVDPSDPRPT